MTRHRLGTVVRQLRQAADPTDAALLQAYLQCQDGDAFAALVRRYQPLVAGVCRRVLGHEQDAEDAAQATFLVLAKKAGSVRKGESLASWLYGTAYRIALQARRNSARRKARDGRGRTPEPSDPVTELTWREVQTALDEEVQRLPETYRAAFVLCCLQGVSYVEAGARLGVGEKAVSSRVTRARQRLYDRLKGRGVELSAVLAAVGIASTAAAGSATATAGAVLAHQAGTSGLPATVVTLAEGATRTMLTTRTTLAALFVIAAGLAGLGAAGLYRPPAPAALPAPADPRDQKPAPKEAPDQTVEITGRVNGPDGKPFPGADVFLWTDRVKTPADLVVRTKSGTDGTFRLKAGKADLERKARVVARARGHGPDWTERPPDGKAEVTLTLARDDVPIEGRLRDLEGRPVAGAAVQVQMLARPAGGDLDAWIAVWRSDRWASDIRLAPTALDAGPITTDRDGRFTLRGLGRERVAKLQFSGDGIATTEVWVLTRAGNGLLPGTNRRGTWATYLARFDHLLDPAKTFIGTVRDKKTGKPIAGITVALDYEGEVQPHTQTTTDAEGRYRLAGGPKRARYAVAVGGRPGVPYFDINRRNIPDTPGLEPVVVDFDLERGLEITGRVTDADGKPVRGHVRYGHTLDNPYLKDYPGYARPFGLSVSDWGRVGDDGRYTVLGIPGPGVVYAVAPDPRQYAIYGTGTRLYYLRNVHGSAVAIGAVAELNVSPDDPKSRTADLVLQTSAPLAGRVTDPDGQAQGGVHVAGLHDEAHTLFPVMRQTSQSMKGSTFTAYGLSPKYPRSLVFYHPEKQLARVIRVRGDEKAPLEVRLGPLASVGGRLVDGKGKPLAGLGVKVLFQPRIRQLSELGIPSDEVNHSGLGRTLSQAAEKLSATTDADGRFRVAGLVPGLPYELMLGSGRVVHWVYNVIPEDGKVLDIGTLKAGATTDLGTPRLRLTPEEKGN